MYTSGTTGDPKGVMISNKSIISLIAGVQRLLENVNEEVVFLSYFVLPVFSLWKPWNGNLKYILDEIADLDWCSLYLLCLIARFLTSLHSLPHTVESKRCIFVIPSTSTYLWPSDRGAVHLTWCFHWVLAWGELSFDFLCVLNIRSIKYVFTFCRMLN